MSKKSRPWTRQQRRAIRLRTRAAQTPALTWYIAEPDPGGDSGSWVRVRPFPGNVREANREARSR
jgi:hypothetical protein